MTGTEALEKPAPRGIRGKAGRIVGIDVARGIALITMAATHIMLGHDPETGRLTAVGSLFGGRASALFAVLAGVSLAIVTGGPRPKAGRDRRRARVTRCPCGRHRPRRPPARDDRALRSR